MAQAGWIKLWREIFDGWLGEVSGDTFKLAIWLMTRAAREPRKTTIRGHAEALAVGELVATQADIAKVVGGSRESARWAIATLEREGFLTKRYHRGNPRAGTIYHVTKFATWQELDKQNPQADTQAEPPRHPQGTPKQARKAQRKPKPAAPKKVRGKKEVSGESFPDPATTLSRNSEVDSARARGRGGPVLPGFPPEVEDAPRPRRAAGPVPEALEAAAAAAGEHWAPSATRLAKGHAVAIARLVGELEQDLGSREAALAAIRAGAREWSRHRERNSGLPHLTATALASSGFRGHIDRGLAGAQPEREPDHGAGPGWDVPPEIGRYDPPPARERYADLYPPQAEEAPERASARPGLRLVR